MTAAWIDRMEAQRDRSGLIEALADRDAETRRRAAEALGHLCDPCPAEALGRRCDPCALGPLRHAAEDRVTVVCEAAIAALERICEPPTLGIP